MNTKISANLIAILLLCAPAGALALTANDMSDIKATVETLRPMVKAKSPDMYQSIYVASAQVRGLCANEVEIQQRSAANQESHAPGEVSDQYKPAVVSEETKRQLWQDQVTYENVRKLLPLRVADIADRKILPNLPPQSLVNVLILDVVPTPLHDSAHLIEHVQTFFAELKKVVNPPTANYARCIRMIDAAINTAAE